MAQQSRLFSWRRTTETLSIALVCIATGSIASELAAPGEHTDLVIQRRNAESIMNNNAGLRGITEGELSGQQNDAAEENDRSLAKKKTVKKTPAATPAPLVVPCGAVRVYARNIQACGISNIGKVRCWGENGQSKLGYSGPSHVLAPAFWGDVNYGTLNTPEIVDMGLGYEHTCTVNELGATRCWGYAAYGQLGLGSTVARSTPMESADVAVGFANGMVMMVTDVAAQQYSTCVLTTMGQAKCWGYHVYGNLGTGSGSHIGDDETPFNVAPINFGVGAVVTHIATGDNHACVILDTGICRCWGVNSNGRLGLGSTYNNQYIGDTEQPYQIPALDFGTGVIAVAIQLGGNFGCITTSAAKVICWGGNDYGQLGYGNTAPIGDNELPVTVASGVVMVAVADMTAATQIAQIATGFGHTCARFTGGGIKCWGYADGGALGYGTGMSIGDDESPSTVGMVSVGGNAIHIATGTATTFAILEGGSIKSWGSNVYGQLGIGNAGAAFNVGDNEVPSAATFPTTVPKVLFCNLQPCNL